MGGGGHSRVTALTHHCTRTTAAHARNAERTSKVRVLEGLLDEEVEVDGELDFTKIDGAHEQAGRQHVDVRHGLALHHGNRARTMVSTLYVSLLQNTVGAPPHTQRQS